MAEQKTNVMRALEQRKIRYTPHSYPHGEVPLDGVTVAELIGRDPSCVYKTLVARGASKNCYVFVIPATEELDLKRAAKSVKEKSMAMLHLDELTSLTGYVRGGCSPIGMKKQYTTVYASQVLALETVIVSAGKIGQQIELAPGDLIALTRGTTADLISEV